MPTRPRVAGRERRLYALIASLPYSGAQTAFFSFEMTIESFLEGHARVFEWLEGVPRECVYDNRFGSLGELDGQYSDWRDEVCNRRRHASGRFPVGAGDAPGATPHGAAGEAGAERHVARAGRLRGAVGVSRAKVGERLPYLLGKLKAPRVLQRLEQTAERARAEQWPYEQFLETLLEAEVFARDASGARMRIRHAALPALKTLEDRLDGAAGSREAARAPPGAAGLDRGARERLLLRPTRHRQNAPGDRARAQGLPAGLPGRLRDRPGVGLTARGRAGPQPARGRVAPARALPPPDRRRGRLPPLERQAANLLFALVSRRYERGSIAVTSNRGFEQWGEILGDAMVAAALIDRLVHHATMITLKGKSYRLRERGTGVAPAAEAPPLRDSA